MVEVDTCPWSVLIPDDDQTINFFIGYSFIPDHMVYSKGLESVNGFICINRKSHLQAKLMFHSGFVGTIQDLEVCTFYRCLWYIRRISPSYPKITFNIFTNSLCLYHSAQVKYDRDLKRKVHDWFCRQSIPGSEPLTKYFWETDRINIRLIPIKSQCTPEVQREFLKNKGFDFDLEFCQCICYADNLLSQFIKDEVNHPIW